MAAADRMKRRKGAATCPRQIPERSQSSATTILPHCRASGSALDAENRSVAIEGATLLYRRFGNAGAEAALVERLAQDREVTLVANGDNDTMMITENSYLLAHHIPNVQLRIYPDAGHAFLNQYPELFPDHVNAFLNGG
jgi:pimeloyl-ACP methyl ester carboxylesterase